MFALEVDQHFNNDYAINWDVDWLTNANVIS